MAKKNSALDFLFSLIGKVLVWLVKHLAKLLWRLVVIVVCHPRTTTALAAASTLVLYFGWAAVTTMACALLVAASTWKAAHAPSFEATAGAWVRTWWRRWWTYRRRWMRVLTRCELTVQDDDGAHLPTVSKVSTTPYWDRLVVKAEDGQELDDFRNSLERLRGAFGAKRATVRELAPLVYRLDFMRHDPLRETVPATAIPAGLDAVDFRALPVGRNEYGDPYTVSVVGGTTCIAGSIGSGKAGLEWNLLLALAPAIAAGWVRVVFIDPKVKELRQGRALCADGDYACTEAEVVALLDRLVKGMNAANERDGEAGERDFQPGPGRPLTLLFIDELAPLLRYWPRSVRAKIEDALGLLLTQGRAVGYGVVGAIQEPTKDTFTIRDLFTRRLALRLPTESHTEAALIEDAVKYGAECHRIEEATPGVFYALESGASSTMRARLGYVQDHHITELVAYVTSHRNVIALDSRRAPAGPESEAA